VCPYWKGYLKLALVSCPISLHAACSNAERIAFRQVQLIDEETVEPVASEHKGRDYEIAKGQYLLVEDAELEAIQIASTHTIEIDSFVPRSQSISASSTLLIISGPASRSDRTPSPPPCPGERPRRANGHECHVGARNEPTSRVTDPRPHERTR
jgi:Ku70/Ku80 beta-barrel domain